MASDWYNTYSTNWMYTTNNASGYVQPDWSALAQQYAWPTIHTEIVESNQKEEPMRGLYRVYIVNPETGEVKTMPAFVARDADAARLKAAKSLPDDVDIDDFDFIAEHVGAVRAKRQVQEVKIAK